MILLIDCNNFFVSCERVFKAHLINKPVIVAGGEGGCVIARSNEAKKLGIPMGSPLFKVKDIIKKKDIHVCYTNFSLYNDLHNRIMRLIKKKFKTVEVYSIDEAFIDFTGCELDQAYAIYTLILKGIGIPTTIGIAKTKTLCKIANHIAKKNALPYFVLDSNNVLENLANFPIEDIWGIGNAMTKKLQELHIKSALDLKNADPRLLRKSFGVVGERIHRELNGMSCFIVENSSSVKKSIQVSRSFKEPTYEINILKQSLSKHVESLCFKLREQNSYLKSAIFYLESSPFRYPFIKHEKTITLDTPTQNPSDVLSHIKLEELYRENIPYKKTGIIALDLTSAPSPTLFTHNVTKPKSLKAIDEINKKFGSHTIHLLSSGTYEKNDRCYTTCWDDLLVVR